MANWTTLRARFPEDEFEEIEFGISDIVRSGLVKSYLVSKMTLGL